MKSITATKICPLLFIILTFSFCTRDLSRDQSISLINAFPEFEQLGNSPYANSNGLLNGFEQGFWDQYGNLSNYGQTFFTNSLSNGRIYLKQPVKPKVTSVTGISDAISPIGDRQNGIKEVQFQWEYSEVEGVTKRFIVRGGTGVAYAQLFDDGWRIEKIETKQNNQFFLLNPSELAEIDKDRQKEKERRIEEENRIAEENRKFQELQEKRTLLIEQSKKPSKNIGTFIDVDAFDGKPRSPKILLTDVNIEMMDEAHQRLILWFIDLKSQPTMSEFSQTAFGWNGYCVTVRDPLRVVFKDELECTRFYQALLNAIADWKEKYKELQN